MPISSERNTLQKFVNYLNELLNQTVTDSRLSVIRSSPPYFVVARLQSKEILPLELKPKGWLHFLMVAFVQPTNTQHGGKIFIEEAVYSYSLSPKPANKQQWIFRYDYRLNPQDNYPHAHLHLNARRGKESLQHIHFPTGCRLSIEQIVAHLITEHGIQPKCDNWLDILAKSHYEFMELRIDPLLFP